MASEQHKSTSDVEHGERVYLAFQVVISSDVIRALWRVGKESTTLRDHTVPSIMPYSLRQAP